MKLARFNEKGIREFRGLLEFYRRGGREKRFEELLEDKNLTIRYSQDFSLRNKTFSTRLELANAIKLELSPLNLHSQMTETGLWAWLSAALFETVCPSKQDGSRSPGMDYRHIPSESFRDFYRHLIRGPVRTLNLFKDDEGAARIILCQPPDKPGDFVEQLASRQERVTSSAVIEVASRLYYDETKEKPKVGSAPNEAKPGSLRRYLNVLDQLELTYDLYSIGADELIAILPNDFEIPS